MRAATLVVRNLQHYRSVHVASMIGVAIATAVLTGALIVGDSVRASLQDNAFGRLGPFDQLVRSARYLDEAITTRLTEHPVYPQQYEPPVPLVLSSASAVHAETRVPAPRINLFGVDDRFWRAATFRPLPKLGDRQIAINRQLATKLATAVGDELVLTVARPAQISREWALGSRDDASTSVRVEVGAILPNSGLALFSTDLAQSYPPNAFLPLTTLQRLLGTRSQVNAWLIASRHAPESDGTRESAPLEAALQSVLTLGDYGLAMHRVDTADTVLTSDAFVIAPGVEQSAISTANKRGLNVRPVVIYLANTIATSAESAGVPYSTVAGIPEVPDDEIWLNQWTADDLGIARGATVALTYYVRDEAGTLVTDTASFRFTRTVPVQNRFATRDDVPPYPGVTDARSLADWDAPFPIDLRRIRDQDDEYWESYHATPKAFIALDRAVPLWNEQPALGRYSSLRFDELDADGLPASGEQAPSTRPASTPRAPTRTRALRGGTGGLPASSSESPSAALAADLRDTLTLADAGVQVVAIRAQFARASRGSTDFSGLFIGFSFFLIFSAGVLIVLFVGLGIERRSREIGLLQAVGWDRRRLARLLLAEQAWVVMLGATLGVLLAIGYARLMLLGLETAWTDAVRAAFLRLRLNPQTIVVGWAASVLLGLGAVIVALRGSTRRTARELLGTAMAAETESLRQLQRVSRRPPIVSASALFAGLLLAVLSRVTGIVPQTAGFFLAGTLLLVAGLGFWRQFLQGSTGAHAAQPTAMGMALQNTLRNPRRSFLATALIASATFVIVAMDAFRLSADERSAGTGGYELVAEVGQPLLYSPESARGRQALGLDDDDPRWAQLTILPARVSGGDGTSCLNLYKPEQPRFLGVTEAFIRRGGFRFLSTAAPVSAEDDNPWHLLETARADDAIPAFGDEAAVRWQLHLGLNGTLTVTDEHGNPRSIVIVGLLQGSILQGELAISERHFKDLFPTSTGFGKLFVDTHDADVDDVAVLLERSLARYALDAQRSTRILDDFFAVQNTYLTTFQSLGGFGLLLGAFGLAAVTLRNLQERRRELALLLTVGIPRRTLARIVFAENAIVLASGLTVGIVAATVAVLPAFLESGRVASWQSLSATLGLVVLIGGAAGFVGLWPVYRQPLVPALRSE